MVAETLNQNSLCVCVSRISVRPSLPGNWYVYRRMVWLCWGTMRPLRIVGYAWGRRRTRRGLIQIGRTFWAFYYFLLISCVACFASIGVPWGRRNRPSGTHLTNPYHNIFLLAKKFKSKIHEILYFNSWIETNKMWKIRSKINKR